MHASSTVDIPATPPPATSGRTFARAWEDIRTGLRQRELWGHLGWQDIKQRYRRSVLGPFWITISTGVMALGLGILYSMLFQMKIETFLPYVTAGFVVWGLIVGCVTEGTDTFIANEGLIKHLPAPITVYVLRTIWRQLLMFAHNLIIYVIVVAIFFNTLSSPYYMSEQPIGHHHPGLGFTFFMAIPGLALLALNGVWVTMLFGIISTRYRDIPQVINSLIQLVFYMTPIVWSPDILGRVGQRIGEVAVQFNPLYHFVQIVRAPLLGQEARWWSWVIVLVITVIGWILALVAMRNYRARVSYWV